MGLGIDIDAVCQFQTLAKMISCGNRGGAAGGMRSSPRVAEHAHIGAGSACPVVLSDASLDEYVGTYRLADKFLLKMFRMNDGLFAQATGQGAFAIFPSAPDEFFARIARISVSFTRDPRGAVNGLVLHQDGDHAAPKLSASELPPEPKEIALDVATLGDYVGKYRFNVGAVLDVALKRDHLEAQLTGQGAFPIFASAKDTFFYKVVDAQLDFERDAGGKVVAVVLHQNGRDTRAPRMATGR
jgi:D-alanyl-D-alanine-carboxypeptidase/D-alanyl-D-alanine-endopeptidase